MIRAGADVLERTKREGREMSKLARVAGLPERILTIARARKRSLPEMARHEAAHAIVALALGGTVWITCCHPIDLAGVVLQDGATFVTFPRRSARALRAVAVAGTAAVPGTFSPKDAALFFSCTSPRLSVPDSFVRARLAAGRSLRRHADAVDRLAEVLLERLVLTRGEVRRVLRARWPELAEHVPGKAERGALGQAGLALPRLHQAVRHLRGEVRRGRVPAPRQVARSVSSRRARA